MNRMAKVKRGLVMAAAAVMLCAACSKRTGSEGSVTETQEAAEPADSIEKLYMSGLGKYLVEQLGLRDYEARIADTGAVPVDEEDMCEAQKTGGMGLSYIYLRNRLYPERLNSADAAVLESSIRTGTVSDAAMEVIIRTFPDVIPPYEITSADDRNVETMYDENLFTGPGFVTMPSLVLNIATQAEYDENGNFVSEKKEKEKEERLLKIAKKMEDELEGCLGDTPIRVFVDFVK